MSLPRPLRARAPRCALLCLALALAPSAARAQPYDPAFRFRTLETEHFRIHYHQGLEGMARQVAVHAERAHAALAPALGYAPRVRTEVVLSDDVDDANGSASPLPYNTMRLYAAPPAPTSELNDHRDWLETLVWHEYVHVLHTDNVGGLPRALNAIFGKLLVPNGLVPGWMIEGLAVLHESAGDPDTGRNASALYDAYARALASDGAASFPRLDEATNPPLDWPTGQVAYLLGGRFMKFVEEWFGEPALAAYLADQGSRVWPYAPSYPSRRHLGGKTWSELWSAYRDAELRAAQARLEAIRRRPVTHPRRLTWEGGRIDRVRFAPDGKSLVYWRRGLDDRAGLRRVGVSGDGDRLVAPLDVANGFALASADEAIASAAEVYREYRLYDDLWRVDLRDGDRERITKGERASEPELAPDGGAVVYVRRAPAGGLALVRRRLGARSGPGPAEVLFAREGAELGAPRLSPDGTRLAFELQEGGRRDVVVLALDAAPDGAPAPLRVTDDDALDLGPAWTPDGRFLLFASDRDGVLNLYAWEAETGDVRQVTNVETAALQPDVSPDGETIAFLTYSRDGYDVATIPFAPSRWLEPPAPLPPPAPREAEAPAPLESRPYSSWSTLRPTFWLPLLGADAEGLTAGAITGGADVLLRHLWTAQGWWSVGGETPGYALNYVGTWLWPWLDLGSSRRVGTSPDPGERSEIITTVADAGATFTWTRVERALSLRAGWSGTRYDTLGSPPAEPPPPEPYRFDDGFLSEASLRATYTDARRYVRSISPEEGRTAELAIAYSGEETGSDFAVARARGAIAQYLRLPWTRHAVLALRLSGGAADGTLGGRAPFELGGAGSVFDPLSELLGFGGLGADSLRGYPSGALEGTGYVLGTAELRLPLATVLRGRTTWPLFLRRAHAAAFLDLGDAFDMPGEVELAGHPLEADELRAGVGAELRLELAVAYHLVTDLRVGVARSLGALFGDGRAADEARLGEDAPGAVQVYVTLGKSF
jgi:hypothetical protein